MRHRYEQTECAFMNVQSLWTNWVCFYDCAIVMNRLSVRLWMRHRYEQTECAFMTVQSLWTDRVCVYECAIVINRQNVRLWSVWLLLF